MVVGVDVGGTKTALMLTDMATGEDLARDRFATDTSLGPTAMQATIFAAIRALVQSSGHPLDALRAVGIAMPGQVDDEHGRIIAAGNLAGWRDIPLRDIATNELRVPVFIENDAKAGALGERWRGAAKHMHNFVFLALGTGAGAGVVINGRLHRGYHNAAGEVGSFIMGRKYLGQRRDGHGNLELLVGGPAIREEARVASGKKLKTAEAFEQAEGDVRLAAVADRASDYIAMAVINIAALLDPEAIILGGGTSAAGEALIDRVRARMDRELPIRPALMRSTLGEDAQLHGAVFGAMWELDPSLALREELR